MNAQAKALGRGAVALALAGCLAVVAACETGTTAVKNESPETSTKAASSTTPTDAASTECATENGSGCAPTSKRVVLAEPSFSDPTNVTNPLFPASS